MKDLTSFLALPTALVTLFLTSSAKAQEISWRQHGRLHFGHDDIVRRDLEIEQKLAHHAPSGVKKMSGDDEGEKFFLHYWDFGQDYSNSSLQLLSAPIAPHRNNETGTYGLFGRKLLARDFECPGDTVSCSSIGSNLCCPAGQTCMEVSSGIGCCPAGETCGNQVGGCNAGGGYTSCPESDNGGCCVPGAQCEGSGCIFYGTETVTATLPTSTITVSESGSTGTSENNGDETASVGPATSIETTVATSVQTSVQTNVETNEYTTTDTVTVTQSLSGKVSTVTAPTTVVIVRTTANSQTSADDSVPSTSPTTTTSTPSSDSSGTASAPIRPTSVTSDTSAAASEETTTTSSSPRTTISSAVEGCPTGYYMCSAYYMGGCCRVGRDCDTTSCPAGASTNVLTQGPTVVVPYTSTTTAAGGSNNQGSCASGWFACGADDGGGCCPSGFACGTARCEATASGEDGTTAKQTASTSEAGVVRWGWGLGILALSAGTGMVLL
ncbi:hypothetical protein KC330_g5152 [Hortaea werneckii]|nr:hypothetical protein KC330_g5152 [Hortaea werneckii]